MGATTPFNWPWPEGTAAVRDGDNAMAAIAQGVATSLNNRGLTSRFVGATQVVTVNSAGQGSIAFTGFSAIPAVVATNGDNASGARVEIINTTTTGFNIWVKSMSSDATIPNATVRVNWIAMGATTQP